MLVYEDDDYRVYRTGSGHYVIAWHREWLTGSYGSICEALARGRVQIDSY